ncbi:MAG TPA: F0F1 ATP synthase subunit delta [Xanthobacteraceae bacterium]|jgi:F-type H+-transporting ATPase subunit b
MRIDWWTLALQTVNVLILIWLLARFFFRPIMDIVAKRQEATNKLLADAGQARQEAADVRREAEKARAEIAAGQEKLIAEARSAAQIERQNLFAQSSKDIAKFSSEAKAAIAGDRAAAEQAIIDDASEVSIEIARRLLARFPNRDILRVFVEEICRELSALSSEARESLITATAAGHAIEVLTAALLPDEEMKQVGAALKDAFGYELAFTFRCDPAIIAGIELYGQNVAIRNSWRANLERIREELTRDRHVTP